MTMTSVFAPITKSVEQDDGTILVYGKATDGGLDSDLQRCDPVWLSAAMPKWYNNGLGGNVREQHDPHRAVGKAVEHEIAEDGHYVTAKIVDPVAVAKTRAGVFTGFSIGIRSPKLSKSESAPNGIINGGDIVELSLCDRPSNPSCLLTLVKAAKPGMEVNVLDYDPERRLIKCEELIEKSVEPDTDTVTVPADVPELHVKVDAEMSPDQLREYEAVFGDEVKKTTDVAHLDAPAPGQTCTDCGEAGHLRCNSVATDENGQLEFDLEAAKALVAQTLAKAESGIGQDESGDISGALQAITIVAKLIASEAKDLGDTPAQGCDIDLLMQAVHALRIFQAREAKEQAGIDPGMVLLSDDPDLEKVTVEKGKYSAEQLRQMLKDGKAFKNADGEPSYPIADKGDLSNAIHAVGRGKGDHNSIRAYIVRRAKALGASSMIPENWSSGGSNKASDVFHKIGEHLVSNTTDTPTSPEDAEKAVTVDTSKAAVEPDPVDLEKALIALVEKAASKDVEKSENPLRQALASLVRAETEELETATKTAEQTVSDLTERLVKVESMAIPGGPSLRRTEVDRTNAHKSSLITEAARFKALAAANSDDPNLRKGYDVKASQLEAELKSLAP